MQSDPKSALACYHDLISKRTARRIATLLGATAAEALFANNGGRQGTQEATISAVRLFDTKGNETNKLQSGEGLVVELDIHLSSSVEDAACTVGIFNNQYMKCFESGLPSVQAILGSAAGARTIRCELKSLPLLGGTYYLNIGLYSTDWSYQYDFHRMMYPLHIKSVVDPRVYATGVLAVESVWNSHG
jgi:lipopolysaccharide transport system ATP-binding protein